MYKQFKNYWTFRLNLKCEIVRENLDAVFALPNNSSNCNKCQVFLWLVKYMLDGISKMKIRVT